MARRGFLALAIAGALAACGDGGDTRAGGPAADAPAGGAPEAPGAESPSEHPGVVFGTQGPWPVENVVYGAGQGIREAPVVGVTTDEAQNRWIATHEALYLLRPGETAFRRYDAADGLHLPGNPVRYCSDHEGPMRPGERCGGAVTLGAAAPPGISRIVGGGPGEVFVGYFGVDDTPEGLSCTPKDPARSVGFGDYCDPNHHSGKLDRVRLLADGALEVDRLDLVAVNQGGEYWHDRSVQSLAYDHVVHPGTLYVGANHGVSMLFPDRLALPGPGEWFNDAYRTWMGNHLHVVVCVGGPCGPGEDGRERMGDWAGLAVDAKGDVWHAGRWSAGLIGWEDDPVAWVERGGEDAFLAAFGDPYPRSPNDEGFENEPVFKVGAEGDSVFLTGVAVCPDGRVWFSSRGPESGTDHTVAVWSGRSFRTFAATSLGLGEASVSAIACLPDGRVVLGGRSTSGIAVHDPATGASRTIREGIPGGRVLALEVDAMVSPPSLHVATAGGAAVLRVIP